MSLEIQNGLGFGLGLRVQRWPKTRHVVLHVGTVESRVILRSGRNFVAVACLLLAGLLLGVSR